MPIKIATLATLGATLLVLGLIDGVRGIAIPLYFWFRSASSASVCSSA